MITRAKIDDVEISVVKDESVNRSYDITDRPTEKENVTDHVRVDPFKLSISGFILGEDAWQNLNKLQKLAEKRDIVRYVHRTWNTNIVIESFNTTHNGDTANGLGFTMTFKEVKIVNAVELDDSENSSQTSEVKDMGTQSVRSK